MKNWRYEKKKWRQRRTIWGKNGEITAAEGVCDHFLEKKKAVFPHKELKIGK